MVHELVSEDFPRIRVGIGKPIDEYDAIDYVIGQLEEETYEKLKDEYLYLKSLLNVAGVNLTAIDKIKE